MPKKTTTSGRITRKANRKERFALSVENLHATFERMDTRLRQAVESGVTDSDLARAVDRAWSAAFHQELSAPAIKGLVKHYRALYSAASGKRKTRKARRLQVGGGGMAPLGMTMGQGITATTFERSPMDMSTSNQVISGLDRFYESPISRSCNSTGGVDTLASQKGGGIFDSLLAGFPPASIPHNAIQTAVSTGQGAPITNPPAAPEVPVWKPSVPQPQTFDSSAVSNLSGLSAVYQGY